MAIGFLRRALKAALFSSLLLVVAVAALAWRLAQGPLSLAAIEQPLRTLINQGSPLAVSFAAPALAWSVERRTLELTARSVEVRTHAGQLVFSAPEASASLDVELLLREQVLVPVELTATLPQLELTRTAPRSFELRFAGQLARLPGGQPIDGMPVTSWWPNLAEIPDPRLRSLETLRIQAPVLRYTDAEHGKWLTAQAALLEVRRRDGHWEASLAADLTAEGIKGRLTLTAANEGSGGVQRLLLDLDDVPAQAIGSLLPTLPGGALHGRLSGQIGLGLDTAGPEFEPGGGSFDLSLHDARFALPGIWAEPALVGDVTLTGHLAPGWDRVAIREARLEQGGLRIEGAAEAVVGARQLRLDATLRAGGLGAAEVARFWPLPLAGRARAWFGRHVAGGEVTEARLALAVPLQGDEAGESALDLAFTFANADVRYVGSMPQARGVAGTGRLTRTQLQLAVQAGRIAEVEVEQGQLEIDWTGAPGTPPALRAELRLGGPLRSALTTLDAPPLRVARKAGIDPAAVSGDARGRLELQLPLKGALRRDEVGFQLDAVLDDAALSPAFGGRSFHGGKIRVVGSETEIAATGSLLADGVPVELAWEERLQGRGSWRREVALAGSLDRSAAAELGLPWPALLDGAVGVVANVRVPWRGSRRVELELDLTPAAVSLPALSAHKPVGVPGRVVGAVLQTDAAAVTLTDLRITFPGFELHGRAAGTLEPLGWRRLDVQLLRTAGTELRADLRRSDGVITGSVHAERLNLLPWRRQERHDGDRLGLPPLDLRLTAAAVHAGGPPIEAVRGSFERDARSWRAVELAGTLAGGGEVRVDYRASGAGGDVAVSATDGGALLRALGAERTPIRGGTLQADAVVTRGPAGSALEGRAELRDFTLGDSPMLARLFTLASLQGLGNALTGQGIPVQRLTVPFTYQDQQVEVADARLLGSEIGARADGTIDLFTRTVDLSGTIAPIYTLNRILGRVPLLGPLLRGGEADAALAATFTVTGAIDDPAIVVNPLSALVPGAIRDLFRGFGTAPSTHPLQRDRQ